MSPEQVAGQRIDKRSDLYSLGCTFFHILTGRRPFDAGSPAEILSKINRGENPSLREMAPALPIGIGVVLDRTMQRDPFLRYQDASIALLDLRSYSTLASLLERQPGSSNSHQTGNDREKHARFDENIVTKTYFEDSFSADLSSSAISDEFHVSE